MTVWVVVVREGGVYQEIRVFTSEERMAEAGYRKEDINPDDFPHFPIWIQEVEVDY